MKHTLVNGRWRWTPDDSGSGGGGGLFASYARCSDHATANGGNLMTASVGFPGYDVWFKRNLDDIDFDPDSIVTLGSDRFTLGAGTYWLVARAPLMRCAYGAIRIYNYTDDSVAIMGESTITDYSTYDSMAHPEVKGRITITGSKAFQIETITSYTQGVDYAQGIYDDDFDDGGIDYQIHASVDIFKEA